MRMRAWVAVALDSLRTKALARSVTKRHTKELYQRSYSDRLTSTCLKQGPKMVPRTVLEFGNLRRAKWLRGQRLVLHGLPHLVSGGAQYGSIGLDLPLYGMDW